jgi:hypothetical protein
MQKKQLTLEDLEPQYAAFCENVRAVKQNTYWRTAFNKIAKDNTHGEEENKKTA